MFWSSHALAFEPRENMFKRLQNSVVNSRGHGDYQTTWGLRLLHTFFDSSIFWKSAPTDSESLRFLRNI